MSEDSQNLSDDENEELQATKLYLVVGVVCVVGTIMVISNGLQRTSKTVTTTSPPATQTQNPFNIPLPAAATPTQGLGRVVESVADGTEAASSVVQDGSALMRDGMGWVRNTLSDQDNSSTSELNLQK